MKYFPESVLKEIFNSFQLIVTITVRWLNVDYFYDYHLIFLQSVFTGLLKSVLINFSIACLYQDLLKVAMLCCPHSMKIAGVVFVYMFLTATSKICIYEIKTWIILVFIYDTLLSSCENLPALNISNTSRTLYATSWNSHTMCTRCI